MANQVLYGFLEHRDIFDQRIQGQIVQQVDTAIQRSVDEHNRQLNALMDLFVERTTEYKRRFLQTTASRLQPLDDNGRARPIRVKGYYDVAWPIQEAGSAWGANFVARAKMTVADANRITANMLTADIRWMRDHVMAALFTDVTWTFDDDTWGSLTINPLANGDTATYQQVTGLDAMNTDDHNVGQAAAIADGANNALIGAYNDLMEHPENGGEVVALVASDLVPSISSLATFMSSADPRLRVGSGTTELVATLNQPVPGKLLGYDAASKVWVSEWAGLPSTYLIAVTTDGIKPLRMREDAEAELQGFKRVADRPDHPFLESQWLRRAGFGAWNRVGAYVARIGNAAYAIPTNYSSPMP